MYLGELSVLYQDFSGACLKSGSRMASLATMASAIGADEELKLFEGSAMPPVMVHFFFIIYFLT